MRMVHHGRVLGLTEYKAVARLIRARKAGSPPIVIPIAPSVPSCSTLSRCGLARGGACRRLVRRLTKDKECAACQNALTKKAPYKETALGERVAVPRALWGFERRGLGV
jgi:hypothetical protein